MKFLKLKQPLKFDVKCKSKVVIPAGAKNVEIAFRQSHLSRWDEDSQQFVNLNVYRYKNRLYHL